jgi:hypothetical protein
MRRSWVRFRAWAELIFFRTIHNTKFLPDTILLSLNLMTEILYEHFFRTKILTDLSFKNNGLYLVLCLGHCLE